MKLLLAKIYSKLWSAVHSVELRFDITYSHLSFDGKFVDKIITKIYAIDADGAEIKLFYSSKADSAGDGECAEPWRLGEEPYMFDAYGQVVGEAFWAEHRRRIVACVNACRGLSADELESKCLVAAVGAELINQDRKISHLIAQRDELLKAINLLKSAWPRHTRLDGSFLVLSIAEQKAFDAAEMAIAKAVQP